MTDHYKVDVSGKSSEEADKALRSRASELVKKLGEEVKSVRSVFRAHFELKGKAKGTQETQFSLESEEGWDQIIQTARKGHDLGKYQGVYSRDEFYDLSKAQLAKLSAPRVPAGYDGRRYSSLDVFK